MNYNPFLPTRFEFDRSPLLWRSPHALEIEQSDKNVYLKGSRGSGKTSLLRAINWRERLDNPSLNSGTNDLSWPSIGLYLRLPDHMSQSMHKVPWGLISETAEPDALAADYFLTFMEALAIDSMLDAAISLRSRRITKFSGRDEEELVKTVFSEAPNLRNFQSLSGLSGLSCLQHVFKQLHRSMTTAATRGHIPEILKELPKGIPGTLLHIIADHLIRILALPSPSVDQNFMICVDDCETLRPEQRKALNTLVRSSRSPVLWAISFVSSHYETNSTMINDQSLSGDDRTVIDFNTISHADFGSLCEEVVKLRLKYSYKKGHSLLPGFDSALTAPNTLHALIGDLRANELFAIATANRSNVNLKKIEDSGRRLRDAALKSEDPKWKKFLQIRAGETSAFVELENRTKKTDEKLEVLPFWQAYVLEHHLGHKDFDKFIYDNKGNIRDVEQPLRRKQAAALLMMFKESRLQRPFYASKFAVISMSDRCIRDFLEIMAEIHSIAEKPKNRNGKKSPIFRPIVRYNAQANATYNSSKNKWISIAQNRALGLDKNVAVEVALLVDGLARLTSLLHIDPEGVRGLSAPERGIFVLDTTTPITGLPGDPKAIRDFLDEVVNRASMDGFLRSPREQSIGTQSTKIDGSSTKRRFQVHCRFSAYFEFSYRGSYSEVLLDPRDVAFLILNGENIDPADWAQNVYKAISSGSKEPIVQPRLNFDV